MMLHSPALVCALLGAAWQTPSTPIAARTFNEVHVLVRENFFDAGLSADAWAQTCQKYRTAYERAGSDVKRSEVLDAMLGELRTSHTDHIGSWDPQYYHLRAVLDDTAQRYPGIGIDTTTIEGRTFVRWIYDGTPASRVGLRVGDEIIAVDGEPFAHVNSFRGKANGTAQLSVRHVESGPVEDITCDVVMLDGSTVFLEALSASAKVIEHGGASIAYVHVWSFAGEKYQEALRELVLSEPLRNADALVLDLRGGLGGAQPVYLNLFNRELPVMTFVARDGEVHEFPPSWRKPAVLLVDETSRSGKEVFAFGFKRMKIGPIVGGRTAGAVVAGRLFDLSDGSALYLAVADVRIDGERLEGVGVAPDVEVPFELPYANGADPRLEKAVDVAAELARQAQAEREEADAVP